MAVFNKCCCCCQLRTGVMVLGWIGLVFAVFDLAVSGAVYANWDSIALKTEAPGLIVLSTYIPIYIAYGVLTLLMYVLMTWGASAGNRFLLLPWLIMDMFTIVLVAILILVGGIFALSNQETVAIGTIVFCVGIPAWGLRLYLWLCVLSCFQEIRDTQTTEQNILLELPKTLDSIMTDYRPPEYERLENKDA